MMMTVLPVALRMNWSTITAVQSKMEQNTRKVPRIIRYVKYNKKKHPENYFREQLMLFVPWQIKKKKQRTNGPVNAHLRSAILNKYLFKKFALYGAPPTNQNKGLGQKSTKL